MVKTIGDAVAADPQMHALAGGRRRTVAFADVDVSVIVEKRVEGTRVPLPLLIRGVNTKSTHDIQEEIRRVLKQPVRDAGDYVFSDTGPSAAMLRLFYRLPQALRVFPIKRALGNPFRSKAMMGTEVRAVDRMHRSRHAGEKSAHSERGLLTRCRQARAVRSAHGLR